jgi:biopolymer transport protein ExbB/TolQ
MYTYTLWLEEVVEMTNIVLLLAALLVAFGVLIGSVLHTQAVHREYRRLAERVRELHDLQEALEHQNKASVLARSSSEFHGTYLK